MAGCGAIADAYKEEARATRAEARVRMRMRSGACRHVCKLMPLEGVCHAHCHARLTAHAAGVQVFRCNLASLLLVYALCTCRVCRVHGPRCRQPVPTLLQRPGRLRESRPTRAYASR